MSTKNRDFTFDDLKARHDVELQFSILEATADSPSDEALAALLHVAIFYISEMPNPAEAGATLGDAVKRLSAGVTPAGRTH